jgi:hypothetical protein
MKKLNDILFAGAAIVTAAAFLFISAAAQGQIGVEIGRRGVGVEVGAPINVEVQPSCPYGYYATAPYECADEGYYAPSYFYNGVFLGVGPWANYGYGHGWGEHRFDGGRDGRGGRYNNRDGQRSESRERGRQQRNSMGGRRR